MHLFSVFVLVSASLFACLLRCQFADFFCVAATTAATLEASPVQVSRLLRIEVGLGNLSAETCEAVVSKTNRVITSVALKLASRLWLVQRIGRRF